MANMTNIFEQRVVDYLVRGTTPAALTAPMRVQIVSALGADDAPSTPVADAIQPLGATATASPAGTSSNAALIRFEGLPNPTVIAGFRIMDSAATPNVTVDNIGRTGGPITVTEGVYEIAAGELNITGA